MSDSVAGDAKKVDPSEPLNNPSHTPTPKLHNPKTVGKKKPKGKKSATAKVKTKPTATTKGTAVGKGGGPKRTYPSITLEDALKVSIALKLKNHGHPFDTGLVAKACGSTKKAPKFFYLTSASQQYGLTIGSRLSEQIELTPLGRSVVYAPSPEDERQKKIEAFFQVEKFKQVYDHYEGSANLPEEQYLSNALENRFELPPSEHTEFTDVFKKNCAYLGIENGLGKLLAKKGGEATSTDVRSMGKPKGEFKYTAFVAMPFSEKGKQVRSPGFFDEVIKSVITPAANAAGFAVETARREDSDIIHHTIIRQLLNADLLIADLTDHNPNVLFELGIRLAERKPVVIIKSKDTGGIFDVDNLLRVYHYDQNLWSTTVAGDVKALTDRITGTWDNKDTAVGYMDILTTGKSEAA